MGSGREPVTLVTGKTMGFGARKREPVAPTTMKRGVLCTDHADFALFYHAQLR